MLIHLYSHFYQNDTRGKDYESAKHPPYSFTRSPQSYRLWKSLDLSSHQQRMLPITSKNWISCRCFH
nr:MAG TPA: hypothetical protein [Caudoviricetes sp.]